MKFSIFMVSLLVISLSCVSMTVTETEDGDDDNSDHNGEVKYESRRKAGKRADHEFKQKKHRSNGVNQRQQDGETALVTQLDVEVADNLSVGETHNRRHHKHGSRKRDGEGAGSETETGEGAGSKTETSSRQRSIGRKSVGGNYHNKSNTIYRRYAGKGSKKIRTESSLKNSTSSASEDKDLNIKVDESRSETGYGRFKKGRKAAKDDETDATVHKVRTGGRSHKRRRPVPVPQPPIEIVDESQMV